MHCTTTPEFLGQPRSASSPEYPFSSRSTVRNLSG